MFSVIYPIYKGFIYIYTHIYIYPNGGCKSLGFLVAINSFEWMFLVEVQVLHLAAQEATKSLEFCRWERFGGIRYVTEVFSQRVLKPLSK